MRINDAPPPLKLTPAGNPSPLLGRLRPGQMLQAVALSANRNGRVHLQIGTSEFMAQTRLQTQAGQRLLLSVIKAGPLPELRLIRQSGIADLQTQALRSALPRQLPLADLFTGLAPLAGAPPDNQGAALHQAVHRLFAALPSVAGLRSVTDLQRAIHESGVFMEAHLAQTGVPAGDLKSNLLRLLQQLRYRAQTPGATAASPQGTSERPGPGNASGESPASADASASSLLRELLGKTEGALARVQLNQLTSLPAGEQESPVWQMDVPIRDNHDTDVFQLRIEHDGGPAPENDTPGWALTLRFELAPCGPVQARLALSGSAVSTEFWAARADTRRRIEQYLPNLERAFARSGLNLNRSTVHQGMPPEPLPLTGDRPLLDEKA